ncbi:hypothetical protein pmac_cds_140 [Pandoravirus macleodensis]|uniref:Uncharacterized protein n=1 Tax=Pandoravirus macleodensis TaxID=2107707 RepID=A0A2U7UED5_9VIRU|nr:hypothetical protein pmac_cds_140 [Pandoravirus macleodensis]AVK76828.1 hypothetical protein pmac_cds_140 [Pandoravirus macleodensis]UMO79409.1 hypothetical protein [Pandoravirus aubagnensis]
MAEAINHANKSDSAPDILEAPIASLASSSSSSSSPCEGAFRLVALGPDDENVQSSDLAVVDTNNDALATRAGDADIQESLAGSCAVVDCCVPTLTKKDKTYLRARADKLIAFITEQQQASAHTHYGNFDDAPIEVQWAISQVHKIDKMLYPQLATGAANRQTNARASGHAYSTICTLSLGLLAGAGVAYLVGWCKSS